MNWKRILMEDILRLAREKGSPPTFSDVIEDSKVSRREVEEAVRGLEERHLARRRGEEIVLTGEGEAAANTIYSYHKTVEELFGHRTAHSFEHLGNRVKYLEQAASAERLAGFSEGEEGVIVSMEVESPQLLSRLIGVGLIPGTRFRLVRKSSGHLVFDVGGRLVMIDGKLAGKLLGVRGEESTPGRAA